MAIKVAVIYYSSTGTTYRLARAVAEGAEGTGAEVRLRKVKELAPEEAIASNEGWAENVRVNGNNATAVSRRNYQVTTTDGRTLRTATRMTITLARRDGGW